MRWGGRTGHQPEPLVGLQHLRERRVLPVAGVAVVGRLVHDDQIDVAARHDRPPNIRDGQPFVVDNVEIQVQSEHVQAVLPRAVYYAGLAVHQHAENFRQPHALHRGQRCDDQYLADVIVLHQPVGSPQRSGRLLGTHLAQIEATPVQRQELRHDNLVGARLELPGQR